MNPKQILARVITHKIQREIEEMQAAEKRDGFEYPYCEYDIIQRHILKLLEEGI